jgi:hypothetical protein
MNLIDMGRKSNETPAIAEGGKKIKISYPGFSMCDNQIPEELASAKVGDMCRLEIVVKKTGDDIDTYDDNKPRIQVEIHKLGYIGKAGKLSKEEYFSKSEEERKDYDTKQLEEGEGKGNTDR